VTVAFRAKRPMNYEMFRPYHERMIADPRFDVTLYGKSQGHSDLSVLEAALPARRRPNWLCKFSSPDVLFSSDFLLATHRARRSVQIYHGVSIKNYFLNARIRDYDMVFALGPYMIRRYVEKGFFEQGDPRLREVGFAKTDRLTNGTLDARRTRESLSLDPSLPTVIYAPSWGAESSLDQYGEKLLAALAAWGGNTIVKLHDNAFDPRYARRDWRAFLDSLAGPRFAAPRAWDVIPLMHAADLLVTDISSVGFEFLQLDRPLLFMSFPGQLARWENADLETWGRKTGTLVEDPVALPAAIDRALASPGEQSPIRRAACADIYFHVGCATDAGMAELYREFGMQPPMSGMTGSSLPQGRP
jgi:CDP-glycerol glycerophosphotransferase (TagB/SpsB family)